MKKTEFLGIRISSETKKALSQKAGADGRTLSNYVRLVLDKEAKRSEKCE